MPGAGNFGVGLLMGVASGLLNGIFVLPMRYTKKWAWENVWLVFSILSTILFPWIAAWAKAPHLLEIFKSVSLWAFLPGVLAGLVWGTAQVMYGLGCGMVGIAIGSATISSMSIIAGTLGTLIVYAPGRLLSSASLVLLAATLFILAGICIYGKAGARKERESAQDGQRDRQIVQGSFRTGMTVCLICGLLGTAFVYGGRSSTELLRAARLAGVPALFAGYVSYVVTFNAGALPGVLYSLYLLRKNRTGSNFRDSGAFWWNFGMAAAMGLLWYGALLLYGMASEEMGRLGPSVAFALLAGGTVLFANLFGWLVGEWKGAGKATVRAFLMGMICIVCAILIIAFAMPA